MPTISTSDPVFHDAVQACMTALRRVADYQLPPSLDEVMRRLGERKEFLREQEHDELLALVDFAQQRTLETLQAQAALEQLSRALPDMVNGH